VKEQFVKQEQLLLQFELERKEMQRKHEELNKQLNITINDLRQNRGRLEEQLDYMKLELETLTRFDKRREAMSDIESAFEKLNSYISEIDGKKRKTVSTLRKLQLLMDADRGKLTKVTKEVQTEDSHMQEFLAGDLKFQNPSYFSALINVSYHKLN
jgi:chromosome segregation ATPase